MNAPSPLQADAVAGVVDADLCAVLADHWEYVMRTSPTWATTLGDHRYDDQLPRRDPVTIGAIDAEREALLVRARRIDTAALSESDRITLELFCDRLQSDRDVARCKMHEWTVDAGSSSVVGELSYVVESHVVTCDADAANLVARMRQGALVFGDTQANLQRGLASGRVSSVEKVRRAIEQLDGELGTPPQTWAMAMPAWARTDDPDGVFPLALRAARAAELSQVVVDSIAPAVRRFRDFLHDAVLPAARTDIEGLAGITGGEVAYAAAIRSHLGLAKTPHELHDLGLAEIARTDRELTALGRQILGAQDLASTIERLRTDPALYFTSREELLAAAGTALDRAKQKMPAYFKTLPKADCVMRETPAYEAPYTTIAYYRQPHYDGSKPGEYFVNTYKPQTRPRFELEALTWHESIPGHHLQIAIAQELPAVPAFRKLDLATAYIEGWALYTERLADEMGLYSSDLDRLGKVSYDAWRASRLVVDTGLHAFGWSRAQAEEFMQEHTALTPINISNEVDRYIGWPGQALAYKVGQLEILRLRAHAEATLGPSFDLPAFHDVVLGAGAVSLPILAMRVDAWIATAGAR